MSVVTVLMPVYNAMPHLPLAVESILAQTHQDFLFHIVNDGSTDATGQYLEALDDSRVFVEHRQNAGPAAASNHVLRQCNSDVVVRMDADDIAMPSRSERQLEFLKDHPEVGLVGSQFRPLGTQRVGPASRLATKHEHIFSDLLRGRHAMCHPTVAYRTELILEVGGYQEDGALEDWDMFLRMGRRARLANVDEVLLHYRVHSGSLNSQRTRELRASLAFACERARRIDTFLPDIDYQEFLRLRRAEPVWRRLAYWLDAVAYTQYRVAQTELLGDRPLRGYARLVAAAGLSPTLTAQRVWRTIRHRLETSRSGPRGAVDDAKGG